MVYLMTAVSLGSGQCLLFPSHATFVIRTADASEMGL